MPSNYVIAIELYVCSEQAATLKKKNKTKKISASKENYVKNKIEFSKYFTF